MEALLRKIINAKTLSESHKIAVTELDRLTHTKPVAMVAPYVHVPSQSTVTTCLPSPTSSDDFDLDEYVNRI